MEMQNTDSIKAVRIFISSPGDVHEERERARGVVHQLRRRYADRFDLQAVLWEELPLQADMSFQQGIDVVLSEHGVDIAVFILWSRLGSPLGPLVAREDGEPYRSGTEREWDLMLRARQRCLNEGSTPRPAIIFYTRSDDVSFEERLRGKPDNEKAQEIDQKLLVRQFIEEEFHDAESGTNIRAYHSFDQPTTFAKRLREHLTGFLDSIAGEVSSDPVWNIAEQGPPFRGLDVFEFEHGPIFFGREDEIVTIRARLSDQARQGCGFMLICGPSGSGKSSLARAGVMPDICNFEVDESVHGWRRLAIKPTSLGSNLLQGLVDSLIASDVLPELGQWKADVAAPADDDQFSNWLVRFQMRVMDALKNAGNATSSLSTSVLPAEKWKSQASTRLVLLVDQLEELFSDSSTSDEARERFFETLEALARCGHVWILATIRSDFYQQCQSMPALVRMKEGGGQFDLLPPTPDGLARVIAGPATLAGLTFERDGERVLSDAILAEAAEHKELLPLVEHLLLELCDHRTGDGKLTFDEFRRVGGVEGALRQRCEQTFDRLSVSAQSSFDEVLSELVTLSGDGREDWVRRTVPKEQIAITTDRRELIDAMVAARLFTTTTGRDGTSVVSVAHEALLRVWPRMTDWIHRNREFLRLRNTVEQACGRWLSNGRDPSLLLPEGLPLEEGRRLLELGLPGVGADTSEYIETSISAAELQRRKATHRRRAIVATLSAATAVLALLGIYAWNQFKAAQSALATVERQKNGIDAALIKADNAAKQAIELNQQRFNQILATSNHLARIAADRGEYDIAVAALIESASEISLDQFSEQRTDSLARQVTLVGRNMFAVHGIHKLPGDPIYFGPSKNEEQIILCITNEKKVVSVKYNPKNAQLDETHEFLELDTLSIYRVFPSGDQSCITMLAIDQSDDTHFSNPNHVNNRSFAIVVSLLDPKPVVISKLELPGSLLNISSCDGESSFGVVCRLPKEQMKIVCWDERGKKTGESDFVNFTPTHCLPIDRKTIFAVGLAGADSYEARLLRIDGCEPVVIQVLKLPGLPNPDTILKSYKSGTELFVAVCLDQAVQNLTVVDIDGAFQLELAAHIPIVGEVLTLEFLNHGTTLGVQYTSPMANDPHTTILSFFDFEYGPSVASSRIASGPVEFGGNQLTAIVGDGGMLEVWNGDRQLGAASMPTDPCEFLSFNEAKRTIFAGFSTGYVCIWHLDRNIFDDVLDRRIAFDSNLETSGKFLSKSDNKPLTSNALDISPYGVLFKRQDLQVSVEETVGSRNDTWAIEFRGTELELTIRCDVVTEPLAATTIIGEDSNLFFGVVSTTPNDTCEFAVFNARGENTTRLPLPSWVGNASMTLATDGGRVLISISGSGTAELRSYILADGGQAKLESTIQGPAGKLQNYRLLSIEGYYAVLNADGWSLCSAKDDKILGKIPFTPISVNDSRSTVVGIFSFEGKGVVVEVPFSDSSIEFKEATILQSIPGLEKEDVNSHFILTRDYDGALLLVRTDGNVWFGDRWSSLNVSLQCASVDEFGILTAVGKDGVVYHASLYALSVPFLADRTLALEPAGYLHDLAVSNSRGQLRFYNSISGTSVLVCGKSFSDPETTFRRAILNIFTETSLAGTKVKRFSLAEHAEKPKGKLLNL